MIGPLTRITSSSSSMSSSSMTGILTSPAARSTPSRMGPVASRARVGFPLGVDPRVVSLQNVEGARQIFVGNTNGDERASAPNSFAIRARGRGRHTLIDQRGKQRVALAFLRLLDLVGDGTSEHGRADPGRQNHVD